MLDINVAASALKLAMVVPRAIEARMQEEVYPTFRALADRELDKMIAQYPDSGYTIEVDDRFVRGREHIAHARRRVYAAFLDPIIQIALSSMQSAVEGAISGASSGFPPWLKGDDLSKHVHVIYTPFKQKGRDVTGNVSSIKAFRPGDTIMLIPSLTSAMYANVKVPESRVYRSKPFMARAARAIRSMLGHQKSSSVKAVAVRSGKAYDYLVGRGLTGRRPDGSEINPLPRNAKPWQQSAWCIVIRYNIKKAAFGLR